MTPEQIQQNCMMAQQQFQVRISTTVTLCNTQPATFGCTDSKRSNANDGEHARHAKYGDDEVITKFGKVAWPKVPKSKVTKWKKAVKMALEIVDSVENPCLEKLLKLVTRFTILNIFFARTAPSRSPVFFIFLFSVCLARATSFSDPRKREDIWLPRMATCIARLITTICSPRDVKPVTVLSRARL